MFGLFKKKKKNVEYRDNDELDAYVQYSNFTDVFKVDEEMKDDVRIAKLNIDENPTTPQKYNVRGIPTLLLFKNGEVVAEKVGALPKAQLQEWISSNVNSE